MAAQGQLTITRSLREWRAGSADMCPKMYLAAAAIGRSLHAQGAVPRWHRCDTAFFHVRNASARDPNRSADSPKHTVGWPVPRPCTGGRSCPVPRRQGVKISREAVMFVQASCKWGIAPLHAARRRAPCAPASVSGPPTLGVAGGRPRPRVGAFGATVGRHRGKPTGLDAMHGKFTTIVLICCFIYDKQQ